MDPDANSSGPKNLKIYFEDENGQYPESNLIIDIDNIPHSSTHTEIKEYVYETKFFSLLTSSIKVVMTQQDSSVSDFVKISSPIMTIFDNLEAIQIGSATPKIVLDKNHFLLIMLLLIPIIQL